MRRPRPQLCWVDGRKPPRRAPPGAAGGPQRAPAGGRPARGAGSRRTGVLPPRIAFLVFTDQAQPSEILAITFTNKAAQEMRGRVERLIGAHTRGMWLMTFHAACARILRSQAERLGYTSRFTI